jgi:hypothetical protein
MQHRAWRRAPRDPIVSTAHHVLTSVQTPSLVTATINSLAVAAGGVLSISWGDGTVDTVTCDGTARTYAHNYAATGTYRVSLVGTVDRVTTFQASSQTRWTGPVSAFAALTSLTYLHLAYSGVSGSVESLTALKFLTYLRLDANAVSGSVKPVTALAGLTTLYLYSTSCTWSAATLPAAWGTGTQDIRIGNCGWPADQVNQCLTDFAALGAGSGTRSLNIGPNNAAPTTGPPDGIAAKATLISNGWSVTTA